MSDDTKSVGETAKSLARNPLGIIALFIVLVYGFASLVTAFAGSFTAGERLPLIYFLIAFPVLVLAVFSWLVSRHSGKLFAPTDFKDEENYVKMQTIIRTDFEQLSTDFKTLQQQRENAMLLASQAASDLKRLEAEYRAALGSLRLSTEKNVQLNELLSAARSRTAELKTELELLGASGKEAQQRAAEVGSRLSDVGATEPISKDHLNVVIFADDSTIGEIVRSKLAGAGYVKCSLSDARPNRSPNIKWGAALDPLVGEIASIAERELGQPLSRLPEFEKGDRDVFVNLPGQRG